MKCCDITAGQLKRKITIERAVKVKDSGGGYDYSWSTLYTAHARMTPKNGVEKNHAGKLEATNKISVVLRFIDDLLADDRVNYGGEYFQIRSIMNIEFKNQWTELVCESGVVT